MDQSLRPFHEFAGESFCQMKFRLPHTWLNWHHLLPSESTNGTQRTDVDQYICAAQVIQTGNLESYYNNLYLSIVNTNPWPTKDLVFFIYFSSFLHILYSLFWVFSCLSFYCIQFYCFPTPGHWLIFSVLIWSKIVWRRFYKTSCKDLLDLFSIFPVFPNVISFTLFEQRYL